LRAEYTRRGDHRKKTYRAPVMCQVGEEAGAMAPNTGERQHPERGIKHDVRCEERLGNDWDLQKMRGDRDDARRHDQREVRRMECR
jgi:hypothetical protein